MWVLDLGFSLQIELDILGVHVADEFQRRFVRAYQVS